MSYTPVSHLRDKKTDYRRLMCVILGQGLIYSTAGRLGPQFLSGTPLKSVDKNGAAFIFAGFKSVMYQIADYSMTTLSRLPN